MGDYDELKLYLRKNELVAMVGVDQQPQTPLPTDKNAPRFPVPATSPSKPNEQQNTATSNSKKNQKQTDSAKTDDKRLSLDSHVRHRQDKERKNSASRQRSVSSDRSDRSDRSGRSKEHRKSDIRPHVVKDSKPASSTHVHPVIPSTSNSHSSAPANEAATAQAKSSITLKVPHRKHKDKEPDAPVKPVDAPAHGHSAKPREPDHNVPQFTKPNGVVNGLIRKEKAKEHVTDEVSQFNKYQRCLQCILHN